MADRRAGVRNDRQTIRCGKGTNETERETHQCVAARFRSGSDQEGRMKRVELRGRMLRSREIQTRNLGVWHRLGRNKNICENHHGRMQRNVRGWQHAWRLGRNHRLAAIVSLIRGVTRHRATALHAPLILGCGRHAVRELQEQDRDNCQHDESGFPSHLF